MTNGPKRAKSKRKSASSGENATPAYFLSLEVERVLCFKDQQVLDLSDSNGNPAQWTVILGDNGVGKTTILRCLSSVEIQQSVAYSAAFVPNQQLPLYVTLSPESLSIWQELRALQMSNANISAVVMRGKSFASLKTSKNYSSGLEKILINTFINSDPKMLIFAGELEKLVSLACYGYGATRIMGRALLSEKTSTEDSITLFKDDQLLINAEEWLMQVDYAVRSASGKTHDRLEKQLNQIIEILKRILPDVEDIRIAPADEEIPRPRAEFLTPYGWVRLSSLGLGYRTAIAWMVDLAVRLFRRYPNSDDPLAEPAIVLVDEIDLHLHPKWQRNIMNFLTERFPNTQFIVTAHSPLVVQAAKDANIVLLRREGDRVVIDNNPEIVDNWRVDQVLTSVFELPTARPADLEPLLTRRKELLAKARLSKADKAELQELEAKIGSLPTAETPDDIKAMDIIRRAAQLLENS